VSFRIDAGLGEIMFLLSKGAAVGIQHSSSLKRLEPHRAERTMWFEEGIV
jgi:hypothetical protein